MVSSKRFKPVQRVAESREQKAAREFGDSQRSMHAEEQKLEVLRVYHQEYLEQFHTHRQGRHQFGPNAGVPRLSRQTRPSDQRAGASGRSQPPGVCYPQRELAQTPRPHPGTGEGGRSYNARLNTNVRAKRAEEQDEHSCIRSIRRAENGLTWKSERRGSPIAHMEPED